MAHRPNEPGESQSRQTTRDQLALMRSAHGSDIGWSAGDAADAGHLAVPGRLLCATDTRGGVDGVLDTDHGRRLVERIGTIVTAEPRDRDNSDLPTIPGIDILQVGQSTDRGGRRDLADLEDALRVFDDALGEGVVTPDHYLHVAGGDGKHCPATEPEETGVLGPWPPRGQDDAGKGVRVAVIDTGWHAKAAGIETTKYLGRDVSAAAPDDDEPYQTGYPNGQLREYQGHGTFIAGVLKCRAPEVEIKHYRMGIGQPQNGGAVSETDMVALIRRALLWKPHIINLSAGCRTRRDHGPLTFRELWLNDLQGHPETVLIAAAGNDGSDRPFYPAARGWAIGVGSLDHNGKISSFSNYRDSADVYVLGRNHVNAFPKGKYTCKEAPNKGDKRVFDTGLARWSGTSFAAPLFAGMVAKRLAEDWKNDPSATATTVAWDLIDNTAKQKNDPLYGQYLRIHVPDNFWN